MQYYMRIEVPRSREIKEILLADVVLTFAFSLVMIGGIQNLYTLLPLFIYFLPISFIAVSLSFILHELMHKFIAEKYGAIAGFRTSTYGLAITLITSLFGFLIGIPGATIIYTNYFSRKEEGIVSIAGPLTNFAIFIVFLVIGLLSFHNFLPSVILTFSNEVFKLSFFHNMVNMVLFISILLAFFNMLPIYPLDGSKVLRWNKYIYFSTELLIFVLFSLVVPLISLLIGLVFMLVVAYIFSAFYRGLF